MRQKKMLVTAFLLGLTMTYGYTKTNEDPVEIKSSYNITHRNSISTDGKNNNDIENLLGKDENKNGVRDDIDTYINSFSDTHLQKNALLQIAHALTSILTTNLDNEARTTEISIKLSDASSCLFNNYDTPIAAARSRALENKIFNTKFRAKVYDKYNRLRSGRTSMSPIGDGCDTK